MGKKEINQVKKFIDDYLDALGIKSDFEINEDEGYINLHFITQSDLSGLMIGNKGKNILSLQHLLNLIFRIILEGKKILVDVDDWKDKEELRLKDLAEKTAQRAIDTNSSQTLYNLTASQRRIVHMYLADKKVSTESKGEGLDRYLTVTPKK